jgi:hypothetical protein
VTAVNRRVTGTREIAAITVVLTVAVDALICGFLSVHGTVCSTCNHITEDEDLTCIVMVAV